MAMDIPDACTLAAAERPARLAEFDGLFTAVRGVEPLGATLVRLRLAGPVGLATAVRDLTAREAACCSFFTFAVTPEPAVEGEALTLDVRVPAEHAGVLAALVERAGAVSAGRREG